MTQHHSHTIKCRSLPIRWRRPLYMRDNEPMSKLMKEETNRQSTVHNKNQLRKLRQYHHVQAGWACSGETALQMLSMTSSRCLNVDTGSEPVHWSSVRRMYGAVMQRLYKRRSQSAGRFWLPDFHRSEDAGFGHINCWCMEISITLNGCGGVGTINPRPALLDICHKPQLFCPSQSTTS
jgi:hypothetical protein